MSFPELGSEADNTDCHLAVAAALSIVTRRHSLLDVHARLQAMRDFARLRYVSYTTFCT
jgi:hypothetical protein